ncbi:MAG: UDP-N-acetylmuramate dehydrogenase, partial [Kiritimatiellaeota bacterium]|nr:UDP-N-acetylmuramate dehydrogenase [Kiritimatiellota bacterium]
RLPLRRFECVAESWRGLRVVSDYAHHPREIAALARMARQSAGAGRVLAIFEPHRYSRTRALAADFPAAFDGVAALALLPVYAASEAPLAGGRATDLYRAFRKRRPNANVALAPGKRAALAWALECAKPGDTLLLAGAGSVAEIAKWIRGDAAQPPSENMTFQHPGAVCVEHGRLDNWTTYRLPASARWRVEVKSFQAAQALLRWAAQNELRVWWFGMGSNTLAAERELPGVAARFAGNRGFLRDGATTIAGCGWKGGALLERLAAEGLSGLEFLEGVPGHLGGWLAMNAGAHGGEIGGVVAWVRALRPDGSLCLLYPDELAFGYRETPGLRGLVAAEAGLRLEEKTPAEVAAQRKAFRAKRARLEGLRTAGSVFKNPPGDFAGRLIEAAGCKTARVGGAGIYRGHANVIVLDKNARASDVTALVAWVRGRVFEKSGVALEPEIVLAGGEWDTEA